MSAQIPSTIRAFTVDEGHKGSVKEIPTPTLGDNDVLIKVAHAAQNPTDWKHVAYFSPPGAITGGDLSGTIVALGPNLKTQWKIGDRVAGTIHGNLYPEQGAFAEYARAQSDLIFGVPDQITLEQAATFGVAWVTALQAIVESQGKPWPGSVMVPGSPWYLVYGGSTAVGLFAIQLLRKIGYRVVAVAGGKNHDLVRSYGAHEVVDYKDPEAAIQQIREITKGGVDIGLDTISEGKSYEISVKSFKEGGGRLNAILWPTEEDKKIRPDVDIVSTLMYTLFGKPFKTFGLTYDAIPTDHIFGKECAKRTPDLIINYGIKPTPVEQRGGLDDVAAGLEYQKAGKVSAAKLVYTIGA